MGDGIGSSTKKFAELRKRAEEFSKPEQCNFSQLSAEEAGKLIHELYTHQVELEIQNEDLLRTQEQLELSQQKYTDLYDFAPVGYVTVNEKGLIIEANLMAADMLFLPRAKLVMRPLSSFIMPEDQQLYYQCRKQLSTTGGKKTCELRLLKTDGGVFHALLECTINPEIDGHLGQFRIALTDVSEQKQLEQKLQNAKREWERTFDAIADIVTIHDTDMRVVRANKAAYEMFQAELGSLNGQYCYELFREAGNPCAECPQIETLKKQQTQSATIACPNLHKIFQVSTSPLLNNNGTCTHIVHIARDITVQKRVEAELSHAQKMEAIGTLAGGIAHDFNNILTLITGYADLLQSSIPDSSDLEKYLDPIFKGSNRAKELVQQILTFSKKDPDCPYPMNPVPVVMEALRLLRSSLPTTVEFRKEIEPNCGKIVASPIGLHRILINLFTNALHAMEAEKGVITVRLHKIFLKAADIEEKPGFCEGFFVELIVEDTGRGMDSDSLGRIFEPYYSTKSGGQGRGLGLAMVHGIVEKIGGFIHVESELDKGTAFHIYFPISNGKLPGPEPEQADTQLPAKGSKSILVVDDEELIADMFKQMLENVGYTVTAMSDSKKALAAFQASADKFDLIITDQTMPDLTGVELAREISKNSPQTPIILCSGYSRLISEKKAEELGVSKLLKKPVDSKILVTAVNEVLQEQ